MSPTNQGDEHVFITDARSENISGERNGYRYELFELMEHNKFCYKLSNNAGISKMAILDLDGVIDLRKDPEHFWKKHVEL